MIAPVLVLPILLGIIWWGGLFILFRYQGRYKKHVKLLAIWMAQFSFLSIIWSLIYRDSLITFLLSIFPPLTLLEISNSLSFWEFSYPALKPVIILAALLIAVLFALRGIWKTLAPLITGVLLIVVSLIALERHSQSEMCQSAKEFGINSFSRIGFFQSLRASSKWIKPARHAAFSLDGQNYGWSYVANTFEQLPPDAMPYSGAQFSCLN